MFKTVLIFISAADFNEQEFLVVKNAFENAGIKVFITSDANGLCVGSNGLRTKADVNLYNANAANFKAFIIIGGNGIKNYWSNPLLHKLINNFYKAGKVVSAICLAPVVLGKAGLLSGKKATCYPDAQKELVRSGSNYEEAPVVITEKIITAQNPSAAGEFVQSILNMIAK